MQKEEEKSQVYEDLRKIAKNKRRKQKNKALSFQSSSQIKNEKSSSSNNISSQTLIESSPAETSNETQHSSADIKIEVKDFDTE